MCLQNCVAFGILKFMCNICKNGLKTMYELLFVKFLLLVFNSTNVAQIILGFANLIIPAVAGSSSAVAESSSQVNDAFKAIQALMIRDL